MPGYFTNPTAHHRISLREFDGSEEWVEVKAKLSRSDQLEMQDAMLALDVSSPIDAPTSTDATTPTDVALRLALTGKVRQQRQYETLLALSVRAWSLQDDAGQSVPVSLDTIRRLDSELGAWLAKAIDAYYTRVKLARQREMSERDFTRRPSPITRAVDPPPSVPFPSSSPNGSVTAIPTGLGC